MDKLISVIVPVYNVEAYLPECLDSILRQDYSQLEVILIDDGSTDNSGFICDRYGEQDARIVVIHQKNAGAAAAKNAGLRIATGTYLSFVDSDDVLEMGAYSHMTNLIQQYGADAVQCGYRDLYTNRVINRCPKNDKVEWTAEEYTLLYIQEWTCSLLWDKLYLRSLFEGIFFEEGHKIDDEYFTYRGLMNANKIVRDTHIVYNYRKRRSSVMLSKDAQKQILLDRIDYVSERRKNVIIRFPHLKNAFNRHFIEMMVILFYDAAGTEQSQKAIRFRLTEYFRKNKQMIFDIRLLQSLFKIYFGKAPKSSSSNLEKVEDNYFA